MKFWLPATLTLLFATTAQAADYRVVYSPSLELEVFIDNVSSNTPAAWCKETLNLRIVSGKSTESGVLTSFLPRVGNLLQNQCGKLLELPWQMTNTKGTVLATGTAAKEQSWRPIVTADATATATASNASPLDLSQPANAEPLQHFDLPGGCHFRTWWDDNGQSLFIPDDKSLTCSTEGWLEGASKLTLQQGNRSEPLAVNFYQGYPLTHLHPTPGSVDVVAVNNQRLVLARSDAPNSWLVLPFNPNLHVWSFDGTLLVKMDKKQASDGAALKAAVDAARKSWSGTIDAGVKVTVLLVDDLHADLADPAIGAWRTVN
ncbi:hypothetical protein [Erwinia sorbitola]|uniref:Type VI secretion system-associated protein n=1 Tax=Erwinia sorbitola TaxID=2681984 RepID=A0A6I6EFI2_9GAMM|nr:hypothetical protein [Erwinia sorbitola]MTD26156.1 hypothetical protein [Erwinia sorbitola]QGU87308.1 hypothetical protein GN242_08825 [Erwinia sorbitola]